MLDKGQEEDWFESRFIVVLAIMAAVGLGVFIVNELRRAHPIVDLRIFRVRTYATGVFLMTNLGFVLYGSLVLVPIFLQTLLGYSALDSGVAMLPRGLGSFLAMPIVGVLSAKIEPRKLLSGGLLVAAFSLWQLSWINLNAGYWDIFWPQFIQGACLAMLFVPLTTATMDPIPKEEMGNATSMFNLMRNLGGSMGIASATTFLFRRQQFHTNLLVANVTAVSPQTRAMVEGLQHSLMAQGAGPTSSDKIISPMPGRIVAVLVKPGDRVAKGQALVILEAMKMEHTLAAPLQGTVTAISAKEGNQVSEGVVLARITFDS